MGFESFRHVPAIVVLVKIILISHSGFAGTSLILMQFLLFQVPVVSCALGFGAYIGLER